MSAAPVVGGLIIAALLLAPFGLVAVEAGWDPALLGFGVWLVVVALVFLAAWLLTRGG
jgi:hypothetical protein